MHNTFSLVMWHMIVFHVKEKYCPRHLQRKHNVSLSSGNAQRLQFIFEMTPMTRSCLFLWGRNIHLEMLSLFLSCYFNRERRVLNKWPFHWSTANSGSNYNIFTPTAHHNGRLYSVSTAEHQIFQLKKYLTSHLWWLSSYARFNFLSLLDLKATYVDSKKKRKSDA